MSGIAGRLEKETRFYENMDKKLADLPQIFREYYTSMRASRKAYTTIGVYINNILHFANFVTNNKLSEDFYKKVTYGDIENYMISLETRDTPNGTKRTGDDILQGRWSCLNTFFMWLVKRKHITDNPMAMVDRPKNNTEHKVTYLTKSEIDKLFRTVAKNPNKVKALRDTTLFNVAIATGLRASALVNINIEDINFENSSINVIEKRQKVREIMFGDNTLDLIKEWIDVRNKTFKNANTTALFVSRQNNRLTPLAANNALKEYCEDAGIEKHITLHKLRASTATNLAAAGVNLQTISYVLGHSNTVVTSKYVAILDEGKKNAQDALNKLLTRR